MRSTQEKKIGFSLLVTAALLVHGCSCDDETGGTTGEGDAEMDSSMAEMDAARDATVDATGDDASDARDSDVTEGDASPDATVPTCDSPLALDVSVSGSLTQIADRDAYCYFAPEGTAVMVLAVNSDDANLTGDVFMVAAEDGLNIDAAFSSTLGAGRLFDIAESGGTFYTIEVAARSAGVNYDLVVTEIPIATVDSNFTGSFTGADEFHHRIFEIEEAMTMRGAVGSSDMDGRMRYGFLNQDSSVINRERTGTNGVSVQKYVESRFVDLEPGEYVVQVDSVDADSVGDYFAGIAQIEDPTPITLGTGWTNTSGTQTIYGDRTFYSVDLSEGDVINFALFTTGVYTGAFDVYLPSATAGALEGTGISFGGRVTRTTPATREAESDYYRAPETGTYLIRIGTASVLSADPFNQGLVGDYSLRILQPMSAPLAFDTPTNGTLGLFEFDLYTVDLAMGDILDIETANSAGTYLYTYIYAPDGSLLDSERSMWTGGSPGQATVTVDGAPLAGSYLVRVDPSGPITGSYSVTATLIE